jgi:hypothetical protein
MWERQAQGPCRFQIDQHFEVGGLSWPSRMTEPGFSLEAGGWIPRVSWRDDDGTIHMIDGPGAFTTWREADEASRFLVASIRTSNRTEEGACID